MTGVLGYHLTLPVPDLAILSAAIALLAFAAGGLYGAWVLGRK